MTKELTKNRKKGLVVLFTITYIISYVTRINYGAVISEMESATGIARNLLSMAVTGSFITYGLGQIISGLLGDKFSPKKIVSFGFIITSLMNLLIPTTSNPYIMLVVWCFNGFAQSLIWPPLVKIMIATFSDDEYNKATVKVQWGASAGTMLIYLVSPLLITLASWRAVFIFSAVCGITLLVFWNKYAVDAPIVKRETDDSGKSSLSMLLTPMMITIMLAIVLQGSLRDGVTTWMPTYISETFNLSSAISILTGVILPIFSMISISIASKIYKKMSFNPIITAGILLGVGTVSAALLYMFSSSSAIVSVLLSAILTGSMHGVNMMLVCMVPAFFKKFGNISTISGIINSCTYVGSAISTYGIAVISENLGWHFTILIWAFIALTAAVICFVNIKPWKKTFHS